MRAFDFIKIKNDLLSAIYSRNSARFETAYRLLKNLIIDKRHFSEEAQKTINQIQSAIAIFARKKSLPVFDGFPDVRQQIRKRMAGVVRRQLHAPGHVEHDTWFSGIGISVNSYPIMLKQTAMIQLSTGCSNYCRRCNEWALPGPRKHFSFHAAKILIKDMFHAGNSMFSLYGASDPLDWESNDTDITDLLSYMKENGYTSGFGLLTKIPRGTETIAERLLIQGEDVAVSITSKNKSKVSAIEENVGKRFSAQHDVEELEIPSGMDEDFSSINSSITDYYGVEITPEGASLVVPTFTSALHPTGQRRIAVTSETAYFLKKRTGRDALRVDYFKPLDVVGCDGAEYTLDKLLDVQVETMLLDNGNDMVTPPGMMNLREYFRTFEKDAVLQRKKLAPHAVKAITKTVFKKSYEDTGDKKTSIKLFRKRAASYLDSCDPERIIPYKLAAFSFFLSSISDYLERHPVERDIILFLRRNDRQFYQMNPEDIDIELRRTDTGVFNLFQSLQFRLFDNHRDDMILEFINNNPAQYDSEINRFIIITPYTRNLTTGYS